ncbi:MAG: LysR family transcriptional regulator [Marinibacterium sp.]|nr:LysR family transcriptional regulator [Marinibacterium sp.]
MSMIDLNTLRYFTSAFETGTFSHAARATGVSQPTVSAAIQKLEDRLGAPLFRRSKTGLTPLPLATRLYHDVVEPVTHLASLETRLRDTPGQMLRIHCGPDMLVQHLTPGLHSLRRTRPALQFCFTDDARDCDIAYVSDRCIPDAHAFIPLTHEPIRLAVARTHPLAGLPEVRLADLQALPLIHRPYCPNADRMELAPPVGASAADAMNDQQVLDLVAADLGVAFVPASHGDLRDDITLLALVDADAETRRIGLSHRKSALAADLADRLANAVRRY